MSDSSIVQNPGDFPLQQIPSGIRDFLEAAVEVNEQGIYCDPNCQVCMSPHRVSAENLWRGLDKYDNDRAGKVVDHLSQKGVTASREVVSNHFRVHRGAGEAEIRKLEYIRKLNCMGGVRITPLDRLDFMMDAVSERIAASGAIVEGGKMTKAEAEKLRADIVSSLSKTGEVLLKLHNQMEKDLEMSGNMIRIHKDSFKKAFDMALSSSKTERERQIINSLMGEIMGSSVA